MSMTVLAITPRSLPKQHTEIDPGYRSLTLSERLGKRLSGCPHDFSWPVSIVRLARTILYPRGFDSHQTCAKCGTHRFYNIATMTSGSLFVRTGDARQRNVA